jgi:hypothetical protein
MKSSVIIVQPLHAPRFGLFHRSDWLCCFLFWLVLSSGAWSASAQAAGPIQIPITLSWKMAPPQPAPYFTKGYLLTRSIPGNSDLTQTFVPDHSPDQNYTYTYSDLAPGTTYIFGCASVCGVGTNSAVETNSEFITLTFTTGAIVPGDYRPPVVSVNYSSDVMPAIPPAPGFQAIYSWSSNATITGTVKDDSHLTLQIGGDATVQNMAYQGTGGVWTAMLTLKNIGTNTVSIRATDVFTNVTITNITVINLAHTNTVSVSPNTVSDDYASLMSLEVNGVAVGKPVLFEKFLDANGNGVIDDGDLLCQSISITDGTAFSVAGIPFPMVPGDEDYQANGQIFGSIDYKSQSDLNRLTAGYITRVTDSLDQFRSIVLPMHVLPRESAQKIVGQVTSGGLTVDNALVFYSSPPNTNWIGGVVSDSTGHYEISCQPGVYAVFAFKDGFVGNLDWPPWAVVSPGQNAIVNPGLLAADRLIQGTIGDATTGLGGQQLIAKSPEGWAAITASDSQGNFKLSVLAATNTLQFSSKGLSMTGCLGLKSSPVVNTYTGDVSGLAISLARPDAVLFGTIKDALLKPIPGITINASAIDLPWSSASARSDFSGFYAIGITAGDWTAGPNPIDLLHSNYVVGDWPIISPTHGEAIYYQYRVIRATAFLSGSYVDDSGIPIQGLAVKAVDSSNYAISTVTDAAGAFRIGVSSGQWTLRVDASAPQAADNATPFITLQVVDGGNLSDIKLVLHRFSGQISGTVLDGLNEPVTGVHLLATLNYNSGTNATYYGLGVTDSNGQYAITVSSGLWRLQFPDLDPLTHVTPDPREVLVDNGDVIENYSIVFAPLTIATTLLDEARSGSAFYQTLTAYGGNPPYTWAPASASNPLPPALQLSADGVLSGIPTDFGSFPFILLLSDSQGHSLEQSYTLIVNAPTPMRLQALGYQDTGGFLLRVMGVAGINCLIQISENFINWTTLLITNSVNDTFDFEDNSLAHSAIRFYRIQKGN